MDRDAPRSDDPEAGNRTARQAPVIAGISPRRGQHPGALFRREEPREFRHLLSIVLAWMMSWIARLLPHSARCWLADRGGDLTFRLSPTYRANVFANLEQVLGPHVSSEDIREATRQVFRNSSRNFADLLLLPHQTPSEIASNACLISGDWSFLDDALARGNGVVLITGHLGAFDYICQVLHHKGYAITTVTARTTARFLFDAVTYLRRSHHLNMIDATPSGVRRVMQALRRGECAGLATDRDFFQNGKPVCFFHRETTLPPGAVRIARDTGAAVVPFFAIRTATGHGIILEPGFTVEKTHDVEADIARGLERVVAALERAISTHPGQWVMFQRVWPLAPADPVRVFPIGSPLETDILERVGTALPGRRHAGREPPDPLPGQEAQPTDRTGTPLR